MSTVVAATTAEKETQLIDRLDHLPFTPRHRRVLFGSGLGWAFDAMDVGLITYIIAVLTTQWGLTGVQKSAIVSAGFIGMAIGATLGGKLADRIGRRNVFTITLIVYGIATGASAFAGGVVVLIILRIIVGLGLGAELPVASTLVSELSPRRIRGSIVVWLEAFWAFGWILAALIGFFVIPLSDNGWRWAFAIGALPALYSVYLRWDIPESVRYLLRKGKVSEAEQVVEQFEESARAAGQPLVVEDDIVDEPVVAGATSIFAPTMRTRTAAIWIIWFMINFGYYGAFVWIPSILHEGGFTLVKSFGFTLIITLAQIPGYALSAYLIERWGRRPTLSLFLVGSALSAVAFGFGFADWAVILTGCLLSFFNLGAWGALYALTPEIYPTNIRGTGAGSAAGFGRIASIVAPFAVTALLAVGAVEGGNRTLLFAVLALAFVIAAAATRFLPELKGSALQQ